MATSSMIAFDNTDAVYSIICHLDGYPSYSGKILVEHYTDIEKVEELMDLGNLSVLGPEIGQKQDFDNYTSESDWCLAYGRDRGEEGQEAKTYSSVKEMCEDAMEYVYVFDGLKWSMLVYGHAVDLAEYLKSGRRY